jgi:hypothetical protein
VAADRKGGRVKPDLDALIGYWLDLLGVTPANGWRVTWGWVDEIPHPDGGDAVGLNTCDGETKAAHIDLRRPRTTAELADLDDTAAHEVVHCIGARMQALLDAGRTVDAHEYLAETLAPAMVRIKGTPRAMALAKAARKLPSVSRAFAKGTRMDPKAILAMLAMVMAASTPEEKEKLLTEMKAQLEASGGEAAPVEPPPPLAADPPKPEEKPAAKPPETDPTAMGMSEEERLAKDPMYKKAMGSAVEAILDGREGLTPEQQAFAKGLGTPDKVCAYLKTVGRVEQKPEGERLGLSAAPRGGSDGANVAPSGDKTTMRLFRILPGAKPVALGGEGVTLHDAKSEGKLLSLSVVDAYNKIRESTAASRGHDRARMMGGAA